MAAKGTRALSLIAALAIGLCGPSVSAQTRPSDTEAAIAVSLFSQVYRNWTVSCEPESVRNIRVAFDVEIDRAGRLVGRPVAVRPVDSPEYRTVEASAMRALMASAPFDVPEGFEGGRYRPTFVMSRVCANE